MKMEATERKHAWECVLCSWLARKLLLRKISPVIQAVSEHLFNVQMQESKSPRSSTVKEIIDEKHFVVKTFISEKLKACVIWG